ncbi:MerR family transcriptional regulator [Actinomadura sp. PM05-2]|uniref:MerR family transcriptional regulator n=2 Tax=Actinomadura parmotrematis TaxID=2864039 RepID=A0ABS7FMN2_9ACTN|nr:MerR family transcriptional regulator [Actinomadura parmotrematis]
MRIGDAAAAAGTTPRALRFYEQRGLLDPPRTAAGQREYGPDDVARVRVVRDLLSLGLTVEDVRAVADRLHLLGVPGCESGDEGGAGHGAGGVAARRLAALDAEIGRLTRLRDALAARLAEG